MMLNFGPNARSDVVKFTKLPESAVDVTPKSGRNAREAISLRDQPVDQASRFVNVSVSTRREKKE